MLDDLFVVERFFNIRILGKGVINRIDIDRIRTLYFEVLSPIPLVYNGPS
ncbi:MAG: hypothetical protein ACMUEM_03435 [Flavobacteriales bacterium AspAUS03]